MARAGRSPVAPAPMITEIQRAGSSVTLPWRSCRASYMNGD